MPRRNQEYMDNMRGQIADAALECFIEKGLIGTSVRDICVKAGISMGALYTHFKDKSAIVEEAVPRLVSLERVKADPKDWQEFEEDYIFILKSTPTLKIGKRLAFSYELAAMSARGGVEFKVLNSTQIELQRRMSKMLSNYAAQGDIALPMGPDTTARALTAYIIGCVYHMATQTMQISVGDYVDEAAGVARHMVGANKAK